MYRYISVRLLYLKILLMGSFSANRVYGIHCYTCGTVNNCDNFDALNENYVKKCPLTSKGCSTYYKGDTIVSMSCEENKFNVCLTANDIEYCYCTYNFCNGNKSIRTSTDGSSVNVDDEDIAEGSGINVIPSTVTEYTIPTVHTSLRPLNKGNNVRGTFILIFAAFFFR